MIATFNFIVSVFVLTITVETIFVGIVTTVSEDYPRQ